MAEQVRIYAGTERGLSVWREAAAAGRPLGRGIPDEPCRAIAGSRQQPELVFAGLEHDGLYRTDDAGQTWQKILDADVWSITTDPTDERVLYVGTAPVHLYRSADRGEHWEELTGLQELPPEVRARQVYPVPGEESHILNIFLDPVHPADMYLALEHGGIIRSQDHGETFEDVTEGIDYPDIHMVQKLPRSDRYFAATARGFFSTTDPAQGWTRAEHGFSRDYFYKFIVMPPRQPGQNPTMLVSTGDHSPGSWNRPAGARGLVFRSEDCGDSWQAVGAGRGLPEEMRERVWQFESHPHDPNGIFAALGRYPYPGVDTGEGTIAVSRDRGDTWRSLDIPIRSAWGLWAAPEN